MYRESKRLNLALAATIAGVLALVPLAGAAGAAPGPRTLTVTKAGTGTGTVTSSPAGIDCGVDCTEQYPKGTAVTLTATPDPGSVFTGWIDDCSGTGQCALVMNGNNNATGLFDLPPPPPPPGTSPSAKTVALKAKPRRVEQGHRTRLTATVTPCGGHEGDLVEFYRRGKLIANKASNAECVAAVRVKVRRTARFQAVSPQQDADHLAGVSNRVKVRVTS
jgi:Divergent InlB B-repeat domain